MAETRVDDPGSETHTPRRTRAATRARGSTSGSRSSWRHHGGRGRHLLHRGRQGLPHPAPVLLLVRQVHARRVVVHAPQVRQPDLRPLLLDGARRGRDVVPDRAPHLPGLLELADARLAPAPRRLVAPRRLWAPYLIAVRRHRATAAEAMDRRRRTTLFSLGMACLWFGADWPVHDLAEGYLYSAHMVQHLVFTLVAAPLLIAGTPAWMWRAVLRRVRCSSRSGSSRVRSSP